MRKKDMNGLVSSRKPHLTITVREVFDVNSKDRRNNATDIKQNPACDKSIDNVASMEGAKHSRDENI